MVRPGLPRSVPVPWLLPQGTGASGSSACMNKELIADGHSTLIDVYLFHLKYSGKKDLFLKRRDLCEHSEYWGQIPKPLGGQPFFYVRSAAESQKGVPAPSGNLGTPVRRDRPGLLVSNQSMEIVKHSTTGPKWSC